MSVEPSTHPNFFNFDLADPVLKALNDVGYENPTPIQARTIPHIMAGRDVIGQAQTGTGKTAAFALPLLSRINLKQREPQVLVLTPTRELAIQVAEAFQRYAAHLKGFHVLPIYGGQAYSGQLRQLKRGAHVVVGTPGRVMDHMRRGTLNLMGLTSLVLDEADEMLRMGFIDDVEWILEQTPAGRQIALFSATVPVPIRKIARRHLQDPEEIIIKMPTATAKTIHQRFWMGSGVHKLEALTRILEVEEFDGMIIFVRTKTTTVELAEKLAARGFAAVPLNGDIPQNKREITVDALRDGKLDIVVATDVAARGLDVDRISHVINYDIPHDTEAYVHRVGRTGRMGRTGEAILFVTPREKRLLHAIEKATRQRIEVMEMPSTSAINDQRIARFKERITETLNSEDLSFFTRLIEQYQQESNLPALDIAAALARLVVGDKPLLIKDMPKRKAARSDDYREKNNYREKKETFFPSSRRAQEPEKGMERFRIEVGRVHGAKPGNIVGAIANEVGLDSEYIGRIDIFDDFSVVDLPEGMPPALLNMLKKVWVAGQQLNISRVKNFESFPGAHKHKKAAFRGKRERNGRSKRW